MAQVGLVLEKVGGAAVPPDMTGHPLLDPSRLCVFCNQGIERGAGQRSGSGGEEEPISGCCIGRAVHAGKAGSDVLNIR